MNASAPIARCTSCGATEVTPPTHFTGNPNPVRVEFRPRGARTGFFAPGDEKFFVTSARVCLACGHVMLALNAQALAELRSKVASLEPEPPR